MACELCDQKIPRVSEVSCHVVLVQVLPHKKYHSMGCRIKKVGGTFEVGTIPVDHMIGILELDAPSLFVNHY